MAIGVGVLIVAAGDMSKESTFIEAAQMPGQSFKVIGQLSKDKNMEYDAEKDPNYFSFYMKDKEGNERKVVIKAAKPQDFERSEEIVITGYAENDIFMATDMLLKCPSKYKDEETYIRAEK